MGDEKQEQLQKTVYEIKTEQVQQQEEKEGFRSIDSYTQEEREALIKENEALLDMVNMDELLLEDEKSDKKLVSSARLAAKISRNYGGLVVTDTKWYGKGSEEMIRVQQETVKLFNMMDEQFGEDINASLKAVSAQFDEAINACKTYESKKNPWFPTGKRRKKQVEDMRNMLEQQRQAFNQAVTAIVSGTKTGALTPQDILFETYQFDIVDLEEREEAKNETDLTEHLNYIQTNDAAILSYNKNDPEAAEKLAEAKQRLQNEGNELKRVVISEDARGSKYNYYHLPGAKIKKSIKQRAAAKALSPTLKNIEKEADNDNPNFLKKYEGDTKAKIKTDITDAYAKKKAIIDNAINGDYAFYKDIKGDIFEDGGKQMDRSKNEDMRILDLILVEGEKNAEKNKAALDAVLTKGVALDNLRCEKLIPYLDKLVEEFLSADISMKMLEPEYIASHAGEISRFIKMANLFRAFEKGEKEHGFRSPFFNYYRNQIPPYVQGVIEKRVLTALPMFQMFRQKLKDMGINEKDMGFDDLHIDFLKYDVLNDGKVETREIVNTTMQVQTRKGTKTLQSFPLYEEKEFTDAEKYEIAQRMFTQHNKEFYESAKAFTDAEVFEDKVKYTKNFAEKYGSNLFNENEFAMVESLRKNFKMDDEEGDNDDYNEDGLKQDLEHMEHVFEQILHSEINISDANDIDEAFDPVKYAKNKRMIDLSNKCDEFPNIYRNMMKHYKNVKFNFNKDDLTKLEAKMKDIKKVSERYKLLESIVSSEYFIYDEFKEMTQNMSMKQARKEVMKMDDNIIGPEITGYYNRMLRFHKSALEGNYNKELIMKVKPKTIIVKPKYIKYKL